MDTPATKYWRELCVNAFDNKKESNEFILFIENCKRIPPTDGHYTFQTTDKEFQKQLRILEFQPLEDDKWTISNEKLTLLAKIKSEARMQWHEKCQEELKIHLKKTLSSISKPLAIDDKQRIALVKEFANVYQKNVESISFIPGLLSCLKYQLQNKYHVIEWKVSESAFTQNSKETMEAYVRFLTGVLGFQLLYQDDDVDEDSDNIVINVDQNPVIIWQMNPDMENQFIRSVIKCFSPVNYILDNYQVSAVKRTQPPSIFQWLYSVLSHCLFFLH